MWCSKGRVGSSPTLVTKLVILQVILIFISMRTLIQKLLRESINEISLNQNNQHDFDIEVDSQGNALILGDDGQGNDLDMILKRLPTCDSCYEFSFSFNQAMVQDTK